MIDSFARLFPTWYKLPPRERVYQQKIIVNWLDIEVEPDAPTRMPLLNELRSWRNREVYYFIADGWDWTKRLFETGQYFPAREDAPERFRHSRTQPPNRVGQGRQARHIPVVVPAYLSRRSPVLLSRQTQDDPQDDATGDRASCPPTDNQFRSF